MEKATEAREKNEEGTELEDIKLSVVNAIANGLTGLVEDGALRNSLQGKNYSLTNNNDGTWTITGQKASYIVNTAGTVTQVEGLSIIGSLTLKEETVQEITVKKYGTASEKDVSWSKDGNVTFVTDSTGETVVIGNPIGDKIYIKVGKKTSGTTGTITVSAESEESKSCSITIKEDKYLGEARQADKYGYKVIGYDAKLSEVECWRLFYQDDDNTYLIAHKPQGAYHPKNYYDAEGETRYTTGGTVSEIGKKLNEKYYKAYKSKFTLGTSPTNMRAVAWMTDTENELWSQYAKGNASWAIASPTMELFVESFNAVKYNIDERIESGETNLISRTAIATTIGSNGYNQQSGLDVNYNHGIYRYNGTGNVAYWWLASPSSER